MALFNFFTGIASFFAAMVSGFILDYLSLTIDFASAVVLMMLIIVVFRIITSMGYLTVNETLVKTPAPTIPLVPGPERAP